MTRYSVLSLGMCVLLAVAASCTGAASDPEATGSRDSVAEFSPKAAAAIRDAEAFRQPVFLEIWGNGPTAGRLEARGYLRPGTRAGHYELTEKADALGATEDFFQDDIPVYYFPIGQRELVEIREVAEPPTTAGSRRVLFAYRKTPNGLGAELLEAGSSLREIESGRLAEGRAYFIPHDGGWRLGLLEL